MKLPLINADDWGMSCGVNEGILDLARRGIVRRVSILAAGDFVGHRLDELQTVAGINFGLHFSVTYGRVDNANVSLLANSGKFRHSPFSLVSSLFFAPVEIKAKLHMELNLAALEQLRNLKLLGVNPEYLDSHHHIHLVPGVIESILPVLKGEGIDQVRIPWDPMRLADRLFPVSALALLARSRWRRYKLKSLPFVYPKQNDYDNPERLKRLVTSRPGFEMIVHPAMWHDFEDDYKGDRVREYTALRELEPLFS